MSGHHRCGSNESGRGRIRESTVSEIVGEEMEELPDGKRGGKLWKQDSLKILVRISWNHNTTLIASSNRHSDVIERTAF